jgi:hypothetical protein
MTKKLEVIFEVILLQKLGILRYKKGKISKRKIFITYRSMKEFPFTNPIMPVLRAQTHIRRFRGEALSQASGEESSLILGPTMPNPNKPIN